MHLVLVPADGLSALLPWPEMFSVQCWGLFSWFMSKGPKLHFTLSYCLALKSPGVPRGLAVLWVVQMSWVSCQGECRMSLAVFSIFFVPRVWNPHPGVRNWVFSSLCSQRGILEHSQSTTRWLWNSAILFHPGSSRGVRGGAMTGWGQAHGLRTGFES